MVSPFQTLPRLVIDQILGYFPKRMYFWKAVYPLLWTCSCWRAATLYFVCETYEIQITDVGIRQMPKCMSASMDIVLPHCFSWFRTLSISLDFPLVNPAFGDQLAQYHRMAFENARNLMLSVSHYQNRLKNSQDMQAAQENVNIFLKYIAMVAPNVVNVTLNNSRMVPSKLHIYSEYIWLIEQMQIPVAETAQKRLTAKIFNSENIFNPGNLSSCSMALTHIEFIGYSKLRSFELIRRCAMTLQNLKLTDCNLDRNFSGLIVDGNHRYITYPNMGSLYICSETFLRSQNLPKSPESFVPFPRLVRLSIPELYPFGDNVLFRGNQLILKYLCLGISYKLIEVLVNSYIFTTNSHPNLQHVKLIDNQGMLSVKSGNGFAEQVSNMTQHARSFGLAMRICTDKWLALIESHLGMFKSVRCLNIECPIMFRDVCRLLVNLPAVIYLACYAPRVDNMSISCTALSSRLKTLYIIDDPRGLASKSAPAILAVAILCPNLQRLRLPFATETEGFEQEWNRALNQDKYSRYAFWIKSITNLSPPSHL